MHQNETWDKNRSLLVPPRGRPATCAFHPFSE